MALKVPKVSQAELHAFHEAHFSGAAVLAFGSDFLGPGQASTSPEIPDIHGEINDDGDDDLGYYSDGVKRTLTDEQIAIFRHSEMEALRRAQKREAKEDRSSVGLVRRTDPGEPDSSASARDNSSNSPTGNEEATPAETIKPKSKQRRREPKPDLRKRTWDIVQPGLDSLDYD